MPGVATENQVSDSHNVYLISTCTYESDLDSSLEG